MKFLLGKKIGMSQLFNKNGNVVPITLIEAGPLIITQIRTKEKDGYQAVQVGFDSRARKITKPLKGHLKELGNFKYLKEFRISNCNFQIGDKIDVSIFNEGDKVKVSGISKGKGFQGAIKRHGFHGMPSSHGHKHVERSPGSIGQRFPQHTLKGTKMAGHMGAKRVTVRNLEVVKIDKENNMLAIKGAVPGRRGALLEIVGL